MSDAETRAVTRAQSAPLLIDVDLHPKLASPEALRPYLPDRWWRHWQTIGARYRHGYARGFPYPKMQPLACRRDAWPEAGGEPGSDLALMQRQHLDAHGVAMGILNPLSPTGQGELDEDFSAAMASATNEWQLAAFVARDPRLRASLVVPYEDPPAAAAEIRRRAGDRRFAHVLLLSRTAELLGKRRYWPLLEAAAEAGLPLGIHVFGYSGWAMTSGGWCSYYVEEASEHAVSAQALVTSLIMEGAFERFPALRVVLIEAGFAWLPALGWRLDRLWHRQREEVPELRHPPSHYLRRHIWASTQPMEETEAVADLAAVIGWIGADRLLFASDYPHWDYDDPRMAMPRRLAAATRAAILGGNAAALYARALA
jgi:predicted TIM-barrel fold metal-dependent hydrolase